MNVLAVITLGAIGATALVFVLFIVFFESAVRDSRGLRQPMIDRVGRTFIRNVQVAFGTGVFALILLTTLEFVA